MNHIPVTELFTYPLKSSRGRSSESVAVLRTGFENDRVVAVIDTKNKIVTGRDCPAIVGMRSEIQDKLLHISVANTPVNSFQLPRSGDLIELRLFKNIVKGKLFDSSANQFISKHLEGSYRLVSLDGNFREVLAKRGGQEGDQTAYADASPVHLINTKTLEHLNSVLHDKVSVRNFRPNIVIAGHEAYEEDQWSEITINGCRFRVQEPTKRCIFTTIDPETLKKNALLQPLASIAKIRLSKGQRPTFGINLVPLSNGRVSVGNNVLITDIAKR